MQTAPPPPITIIDAIYVYVLYMCQQMGISRISLSLKRKVYNTSNPSIDELW